LDSYAFGELIMNWNIKNPVEKKQALVSINSNDPFSIGIELGIKFVEYLATPINDSVETILHKIPMFTPPKKHHFKKINPEEIELTNYDAVTSVKKQDLISRLFEVSLNK
jgi:hypothetical protein